MDDEYEDEGFDPDWFDWDEDDFNDDPDDFDGDEDTMSERGEQDGLRSEKSLQYFLSRMPERVFDSNHYGKLYAEGTLPYEHDVKFHNYACHSYLASGLTPDSIVVSCIYINDHEWPVEEQNLYFEYILSDESPWRDVIPHLDLNVIRAADGTVTWIQVRNLHINRWIMFHFLKSVRQIWERRRAIKLFTDAKKAGKEGAELYNIYLLSQLFFGPTKDLQFEWGGDHKVLRGLPNQNLVDKKIYSLDKRINRGTYHENMGYYGEDLYNKTFGEYVDRLGFDALTQEIRDMMDSSGKVFGYFFSKPTIQKSWTIDYETVSSKMPELIEFVKQKGHPMAEDKQQMEAA